eukprot:m.248314 g.248314  ORF g.248314 m.248314 type:complete len:342 (+) comp10972_c0_seq22:664-1689(+)
MAAWFDDDIIEMLRVHDAPLMHFARPRFHFGNGHDDEDDEDEYNETPLHCAARDGNLYQAKRAIRLGANIHALGRFNDTPLHYAARSGEEDIARLLISKGADVNRTNKSGQTPLFLAVRESHGELAQILLVEGANPNFQSSTGESALHYAASKGQKIVVEALLGSGAIIDIRDKKGATPLHWAASANKVEVMKAFIDAGADIHVQNDEGKSPPDLCRWMHHSIITKHFEFVQSQHWHRLAPLKFGVGVQPVIFTTLLCAKHRGLYLPLELWEMVFSHLQRRDFNAAATAVPKPKPILRETVIKPLSRRMRDLVDQHAKYLRERKSTPLKVSDWLERRGGKF